MGAKIGVLLNCGQQSQFSKVRREFDAGRVNLDPPMTCADWPVPGNLTLLHPQTAYTRKPLHRFTDTGARTETRNPSRGLQLVQGCHAPVTTLHVGRIYTETNALQPEKLEPTEHPTLEHYEIRPALFLDLWSDPVELPAWPY